MKQISDLLASLFGHKKSHRYTIGGKDYVQKPLVLGQIRQLLDLLQGTVIPGNAGVLELVFILGDKLSAALAIILIVSGLSPEEEEQYLKERDVAALAAGFEFTVSPELALEALNDFLACNQPSLLWDRLAGLMEKIGRLMPAMPTGSPNWPSSSPTGTLPGATGLSGV